MSDVPTAGAVLAKRLTEHGVKTVFSLGGAGHTHLLLPLQDLGVKIIGSRHETGAVGAADGYARATGRLGVATIIAEQGLPNAMSAIATSHQFGSPVVVLVTRFPNAWVEAAGEFVVDHHRQLLPITKWARTVPSAAQLPDYLDVACRMAQEGRPGPVVLIIPQDYLAAPTAPGPPKSVPHKSMTAFAGKEAIAVAAERVTQSQRPAILLDSGAAGPETERAAALLHDQLGIPIFAYGSARGAIAENQSTVLPWPFAQLALPKSDLLIVAGARLDMWFGFGRAPRFPDDLPVIQIDQQPEAIGRNRPVTLGIVGEPGNALGQLAENLLGRNWRAPACDWLNDALSVRRSAVESLAARTGSPVHALSLIAALQAERPQAGIMVADGADILNWTYGLLRIGRKRGYMDHHPMGSMGLGLPLAVGAAAAELDLAGEEGRPVEAITLLTGDGAIGFYIAELDTIRREKLPVKIIVSNDGLWGTEFHGQMLITGRSVNTVLGRSDYAMVARGFGWAAETVDTVEALPQALKTAFETEGPAMIDVHVDSEAGVDLKRNPALSFLIFSDLAPPRR